MALAVRFSKRGRPVLDARIVKGIDRVLALAWADIEAMPISEQIENEDAMEALRYLMWLRRWYLENPGRKDA